MAKVKIAFFGSSLVSAYWNGAATYYRGIIKALHGLGYDVVFYEPDAYDRQSHIDVQNPDYARSVVYPAHREGLRGALRDAEGADIIIKNSGVGVLDEVLEAEVLAFKGRGARVVFWDVDAPATLDRVQGNPNDPFRGLIPEYDLILTYGGGEPVVRGYGQLRARRCIPIYNALDPETHHPVRPEHRFRCDLAFLGNRMPDREAGVAEFLFKAARSLPGKTFILGGNGWQENIPALANLRCLGHVYTQDHNALNSTATAVLNISRESMARYGFSPATRVFEAAGAGACLITDSWEGIELFLEPGEECLVAAKGEEVVEHLMALTATRARDMGEAARRRVLAEHTYQHRSLELERILVDLLSSSGEKG